LNRWLGPLPEEELGTAAPRIASLSDWKTVMLGLAERAERGDRMRAAAFYYRAAEFFLDPDDPDKNRAYRRFVELFDRSVAEIPHRRARVPYQNAWLPAIIFRASEHGRSARSTLLLHGGFDSLMEELFDWALYFAAGGYDVVLFEGPGQGATLRDHGLVMRPQWEHAVTAVLDYLRIDRASLLGISLGGYLAPRAAAFEPRIESVAVCDVLDDFFDCFTARAEGPVVETLVRLLAADARSDVNAILERVMRNDASTAWAIRHGMRVSGAVDAYEFLLWLREMNTAPFSDRITQDVLLLAGSHDHIVPIHQLWRQARNLRNARSLTVRVFTASEQAHSHCQIGNVGLALDVIRNWLDHTVGRS
jgi:pimeloyl-ACP methyl ester carboxylesterase